MVSRELAGEGRLLLVGRSPESLGALGRELDCPVQVARLEELGGVLEPGDVVVSTVGPYDLVGDQVVTAAIASACTYVDVTGEPRFLERIYDDHGPEAGRHGVMLLPAAGYEFVPGHLLAHRAATAARGDARTVEIAYLADGGLQAGSASGRRSLVRAMTRSTRTFRDGMVRREPVGERRSSFRTTAGRRSTVSIGGAEVWTLRQHFPELTAIDVHSGWFGPLGPAVTVGGQLTRPLRLVRGDWVLDRALALLGDGPEEGLAEGTSRFVARCRDERGRVITRREAVAGNAIVLAARLAAATADRLAQRDLRDLPTGATDPIGVFGIDGLAEICAWAGLVELDDGP